MSRWDMDLSHKDAANKVLLIGGPDLSGAWHRTGLSEAGWRGTPTLPEPIDRCI